ncbi:MAG: twin-arginine translocation signal domain-containing protein [Eggerthellaceae bacterium]|nr:twin-arginine translocation signal domain-containing protein [Eggerthellaceae bacterium]
MVATDLSRRDLLKVAGIAVLAATAPLSPVRAHAAEKPVLTAGDRFTMGEWGGEPILWRVLGVGDGNALVISECGIDCQKFNYSVFNGNDWETSNLKAWLNGEFFFGAFTPDEQARTQETTCLSVDEAERYFKDDNDRVCKPTAHVVQQGAYAGVGGCCWWLRSPGKRSNFATCVYSNGYVNPHGEYVSSSRYAVRPALWLGLE